MKEEKIQKVKLNEIDIKNLNINVIKGLYLEYKEVINYLIFGVGSMIVNFASYFIFARLLKIDEVVSSAMSWFCAVLFAYITNKLFVFESKTTTVKEVIKECVSFFLARIVTGILCDVGTFAVMVKVLKINDIISKVVSVTYGKCIKGGKLKTIINQGIMNNHALSSMENIM